MKKYVIMIMLISFIFIPSKAKAIACSNQDLVRLTSLSNNITYKVDAIENNGTVTFNVTFYNIDSSLRLIDPISMKELNGSTITISNLFANRSYSIRVSNTYPGCSSYNVKTIYVNTPGYNPYYQDEICKGIEHYSLCQKWVSNSLSHDEFINEIQKYKDSLKKQDNNESIKKVKGIYDYIWEFFTKYYFIILPIVIIGGVSIIVYLKKRDSFF